MNDRIDPALPSVTASAPGRMDVMGGIADYSGSLLLQMPIRERTSVTVQHRADGWICIQTKRGPRKTNAFKMHAEEVANAGLHELSRMLRLSEQGDWAAYVIGSIAMLFSEKIIPVCGLTLQIKSQVPEGKGVSSSAALEVAVMSALTKLFGVKTDPYQVPLLAQKAENLVVGAPCGLMDQLSTYLGEKGKLLQIVCQPYRVGASLALPNDLRLCAIDSGVRHAVSGNSYTGVRTAAFMAYAIIAMAEGCSKEVLATARKNGQWTALPYGGYLSNIPLSHFKQHYQHLLPERMKGDEYQRQYGVHIDPNTEINEQQWYYPRACALHPVEENARIPLFRELLLGLPRNRDKETAFNLLGELMLQSHAGYSAVGLGNEKTDALVSMLMDTGRSGGIYGARVSGGGSGGTVVVLCRGKEGVAHARQVWQQYNQSEKIHTAFFYGSSNGAFHSTH